MHCRRPHTGAPLDRGPGSRDRAGPLRATPGRAALAFAALGWLLATGPAPGAVAQGAEPQAEARVGGAPLLVLFVGDPQPDRPRTWRTHVERAARIAGHTPVTDPEAWAGTRSASLGLVSPERVAALAEVEVLLLRSRQEVAALREGEALALLARAAQIAEAHADVPGAAAWIAEVQTAIGIAAAQAGLEPLMESALSQAATLDPSRGVRAAEASPRVVSRAEAIARAAATRPTGSFQVRADTEGATVYLDDRILGAAPQIVRAPVGRHVLRIEAPGRRSFGRVIDVLEGRRPSRAVHLSPDPLVTAARRLPASARAGEEAAIGAALRSLDLGELWVVEVGAGEVSRALLTPCTPEGCGDTRRLEVDEVPIVVPRALEPRPGRFAAGLASNRGWLVEPPAPPPPPPPPTPLWERWYVWALAGVVAATAVGAVLLLRPEADQAHDYVIVVPEGWDAATGAPGM